MYKEYNWNGPQDEPICAWDESDLYKAILDRFAKIVEQHPNKIAVYDVCNSLSYKDLFLLTCTISERIKSKKCNVIGILLPASYYFIASMLASSSTGIPYVPLDINLPKELINNIISESKIDLIITDNSNLSKIDNLLSQNIINIDYEEILPINSLANYKIDNKSNYDSIACIIYTSGTTGRTKGVFQSLDFDTILI